MAMLNNQMVYESQWEGLSHILWKITHFWNHQPVKVSQADRTSLSQATSSAASNCDFKSSHFAFAWHHRGTNEATSRGAPAMGIAPS